MARRGRTIDYKTWSSLTRSVFNPAAGGTFSGSSFASGLQATILRARGYVQATMDSTKQVGDNMTLTFALGIVSTDAFGAGAGSLPDPAAEPEYPWLWWGAMDLTAQVAAGDDAWGSHSQRLEVDTKAMRRLNPSQSLIWVAEATSVAGAPVVEAIFGQTRVLIGT